MREFNVFRGVQVGGLVGFDEGHEKNGFKGGRESGNIGFKGGGSPMKFP